MAFSGSQVTRLGIGGGIWRAYGDFSGKTEQEIVTPEPQETFTGGFWSAYEDEQLRRRIARQKRKEKEEEAKRIKDELDRQLALAQRALEQEEARKEELAMVTKLTNEHKEFIQREMNERVNRAYHRAITQANYSAMEALERELMRVKEEEDFLIQAAYILLNQ